jgi:hypothetical protein
MGIRASMRGMRMSISTSGQGSGFRVQDVPSSQRSAVSNQLVLADARVGAPEVAV